MNETTRQELSVEEWTELSNGLSEFHNIFYRFWTICRPVFSERIKTAAVVFDKDGNCVEFLLNYEFWQSLTLKQKLFVISHECLHLILNHGKRGLRVLFKGEEHRAKLNTAMDICVNESLIARYGFDRLEIDPTNKYVWADKVGATLGIPDLATDRCFEYYYNLFQRSPDAPFLPPPSGGAPMVGETVDEHTDSNEEAEKQGSEALERMADELDDGETNDLENMLRGERNKLQNDVAEDTRNFQAGNDPLGHTYKLKEEPIKIKKKWESIIRKWTAKQLTLDMRDDEQWAKTARRFTMLDRSLSLPFDMEVEAPKKTKKKIDVWFFLDTSGSCIHLASRFFRAAASLPPNRFNVHLFCFDTKVYPSDLKQRKVKGGGGTKFDIIERYIINYITKEEIKYPDGVFVITDGEGNDVHPKKPGNWHWFLTQQQLRNIPSSCHTYNLKEYE